MSAVAGTIATPWEYAGQLLTVASDALAVTQGGPIDFQFVDHEVTAIDCELLAVLMGGISMRTIDRNTELGAGHAHRNGWLNLVQYRIVVARDCIPAVDDNGEDGAPPTAEQRSAAMMLCAEDVWAIWHALVYAMGEGGILAGKCMELLLDNASPIPVSGMTAGWVISCRATVPGFVL